ncbi:hypothetical protein [Aminobacterium colombiense]|jgi:hypothetical protein|uniref:hypothetical protein n=1 Tax=Aminobacterium colombiense TaxID=81468 RepID=UPI0025943960|nr:hypothetical protein [uncultured Aminobacterium sp.]
MKVISVRFNQGDQDLQEYFNSLEPGKRGEEAKSLLRLGLAVRGIDLLQQLVEKGIVSPLGMVPGQQTKLVAASKEDQEIFIKNMAGSWE